MKKSVLFLSILFVTTCSIAQGNSQGKGKGHEKNEKHKHDDDKDDKDDRNRNEEQDNNADHQPKKVTASLLRDYPSAKNIRWSKYKGDYTATFNNGPWTSTAVYHANGDRRDTRTVLTRNQLPGSVWDQIFKRDNITPSQYIQIERPSTAEKIFRILTATNTAYFYDQKGNKITYNY